MEKVKICFVKKRTDPLARGDADVGRRRIRMLWLMLGCVAALLLTGCGMNTDLKIDGQFKGERI